MPSVDADRRHAFRAERMKEPDRERSRLEHHPLGRRGMLTQQGGDNLGIGRALAASHPLAVAPYGDGGLFHRHVQTDILFHGCSPSDAWARLQVVSPYFHLIGEQPPASMS